jgi:hypothetical protein
MLDYADERCTLSRKFGTNDDALLLRIDSFGTWTDFRVTLSGGSIPASARPAASGSYQLSGDRVSRAAALLQGTVGEQRTPAVSLNIRFAPNDIAVKDWAKLDPSIKGKVAVAWDRPRPEFDGTVESIRVSLDRGPPLELHVGKMAEPLAAMRACIEDLYKSWGMDPATQRSLSTQAEPLPSTIKQIQKEYPGRKLMNGISAYVPVRLFVDAQGHASSCVVQSESVDPDFKNAVCANLQRTFEPARDAGGTAVRSIYHTSVMYLIPS